MAYRERFSNPFGFTVTPWVKRIIGVNVAVFVVTAVLPGLIRYLQFAPTDLFPFVWTPITYMFVHGGIFHLLFNMLVLFFFGPPLEERWGSSEFVRFYLLAGLGGALLSGLLSIISPYPIIGASGAVYGIMVAYAMYWPDNPIYIWGIFPIKAKWLVTFIVAFSLVSAFGGGGSGVAHLAHLGGAFTAIGYLKSRWAPSQWGERPAARGFGGWRASLTRAVRPKRDQRADVTPIASSNRRRESPRSGDDVDRILEKISKGGLASLTPEERRQLEEASRKFRAH